MKQTFWRVMSVTILAFGLLALVACGSDAGQPGMVVPFTPSATLIPEFIATPQAAQAAAQATLFYGQAAFSQLDHTATALAIGREAVALEMTRAAATDWHFATQTQDAKDFAATATQGARDATGTAQAETDAHATHTRQALDAAHTAEADAWSKTATAAAQAAAEALAYAEKQAILAITQAAAQDAINRLNDAGTAEAQRLQAETQAVEVRTWAVRFFVAAIAVMLSITVLVSLWQFRRLIVARIMAARRRDGSLILPNPGDDGAVSWYDPSRSPAPVVHIAPDGEVKALGMLDQPDLQAQIVFRALATDLMRAINAVDRNTIARARQDPLYRAVQRWTTAQMLRGASPQALPKPHDPPPSAEIVDTPQVRLLPPDDPELRGWLNDIAPFLLDDGESE